MKSWIALFQKFICLVITCTPIWCTCAHLSLHQISTYMHIHERTQNTWDLRNITTYWKQKTAAKYAWIKMYWHQYKLKYCSWKTIPSRNILFHFLEVKLWTLKVHKVNSKSQFYSLRNKFIFGLHIILPWRNLHQYQSRWSKMGVSYYKYHSMMCGRDLISTMDLFA